LSHAQASNFSGFSAMNVRPAPVIARRMSVSMLILRTPCLMASWISETGTLNERVELVPNELRQVGACSVFGLGEEGRGVLLQQTVQRGLFRAVALVVDRGASGRPLWLPANGLHCGPPRW
jgi:hypothetical protein